MVRETRERMDDRRGGETGRKNKGREGGISVRESTGDKRGGGGQVRQAC